MAPRSEDPKLTTRIITFKLIVYDHDTSTSQTDGRAEDLR